MSVLRMSILILWDWSRSFFGTVFVACVLIGFVLFLVELAIYRAKKKSEKTQ
ncbi:MAG: hypothetical protein LIO75_00455 [Lachnospiraceae bacterium]|nr:hypothetical protein [Lachnospiraceae bacterium]